MLLGNYQWGLSGVKRHQQECQSMKSKKNSHWFGTPEGGQNVTAVKTTTPK